MRDPAAEHGQCERYAYGESHRDRCVCCRAIVAWWGWRVTLAPGCHVTTCGSHYCVARVERARERQPRVMWRTAQGVAVMKHLAWRDWMIFGARE